MSKKTCLRRENPVFNENGILTGKPEKCSLTACLFSEKRFLLYLFMPHCNFEILSCLAALNFEPYGLSFASSVSSSGVTGRQSPAGLSFGSDTSGNSAETGHKE